MLHISETLSYRKLPRYSVVYNIISFGKTKNMFYVDIFSKLKCTYFCIKANYAVTLCNAKSIYVYEAIANIYISLSRVEE